MLIRYILIIVFAIPMIAFAKQAPTDVMQNNINAVKKENSELSRQIKSASSDSTVSLKKMKSTVASLDNKYKNLRDQFEKLLDVEQKLTAELEDKNEEIKALEGAVRASAKEADEMMRNNAITAEHPERAENIETLLDSKKFPGLDNIKNLVEMYFQEMSAGREVRTYSGDVVASDGNMAEVEIIRLGKFVTYYKDSNKYGLLKPNEQGNRLIAVSGSLPKKAVKALESGEEVPMDFSGGVMFTSFGEGQSLFSTIKAGGLLVYPIIGVGLIALVLIFERLFVLGRIKATSGKRMDKIMSYADEGDWGGCEEFCEHNSNFPTCRVLKNTMLYKGESQEVIEHAMQEAILRELPKMERFLPTLSILAAVAPLLGLLGTVTGMINTFNILTIFGTGDPRMMSGGISEALVTTQLGLAVAIPVMLCHHMLERRVDKILADIEEKGTRFSVALLKKEMVRG